MAFSRGLGVIGIVGISWFVAVGCGDDDGKNVLKPDAGGEGGEAPSGGTTNVAGSTANGGKAGMSTAGTGGTAIVIGGSGGEGAGGAGGEPPVPPGGGAAGDGGASGAGGEPPVVAKQCANECEIDEDCVIEGADLQRICDEGSKRCVDPTTPTCTISDDCFPSANLWVSCDSSSGCDEGQACITWQGSGYCAYLNAEVCFEGEIPLTLGEFGKPDSPLEVCVVPAGCNRGACEPACDTNGCGDGGLQCGATSHLCECSDASECPDSGACGADHLCAQCVTDDDCAGAEFGLDKCVNGVCGCSSESVCPDPTAAATPVCE
jgi:hypothetical protein